MTTTAEPQGDNQDRAQGNAPGSNHQIPRSAIRDCCDGFADEWALLDPTGASMTGVTGLDSEMTDYSPAGHDARLECCRRASDALARLSPQTARDRVAKDFVAERIATSLARGEAGEDLRSLNILHSPLQSIRQVFDLMTRNGDARWEAIASRMEKVPLALEGLRESIRLAISRTLPPARRQVLACVLQARIWSGQPAGGAAAPGRSYFATFVASYDGANQALTRRLQDVSASAAAAYGAAADWLQHEVAGAASEHDAVGAERYALGSRTYLGAPIDPVETYAWGWDEVHRIEAEMRAVAEEIRSGASVAEAVQLLESDPGRAIHGEDELRVFLQDLMDRTIAQLDGVHFDIPAPLRILEAMIDPPGGAAAPHYSPPSEDFSRPGRTWYPTLGKSVFPLWGEITTCYHEGVPGHHLQSGHVRWLRDELTKYQRRSFLSGHGEGWALYAERLMDELGKFERPDYRLGYLRSQLMRAVRVVVDIGMHLEYDIPMSDAFHPGERWTPELGAEFLFSRTHFPRDFMASELDRYLGLPGQAISYKVGERSWLEARRAAKRASADAGVPFDLKAFHNRALGLGPVGLDLLVAECGASVAPTSS